MTEHNEIPYEGLAARFRVVEAYSGGEGWSGLVVPRDAGEDPTPRVLKILDAGIRPQEASVLASLEHPSIPRILDVGHADEHWFLLREHVAGTPLQQTFPLDVDDAKRLAVSLLTTLAFVHMRGILHLDLKPSNVIRRDDGEYALLDFGLASRSGDRASGGSLMFAAPERLVGAAADESSDLYSV
ncbi:MAG: protein kinase, partial [Planctomycetes bacterium]|nr:protein kinase [Planctomycetota bacterium]